jgi:hypothetical protein
MNYKMNQNAIDELVAIHNRLKLLSYTMASIKQNASKEIKLALKNVHSLDIDSMNWSELYENEEAIRNGLQLYFLNDSNVLTNDSHGCEDSGD